MNIKEVPIDKLKPYENNPRFNDDAVDYVVNSIQSFGFRVPIIVDKNNTIIAGHTRLKAAKKLKLKKVPVIEVDDLTEEQANAFRIYDNKVAEASKWDLEKLGEELDNIIGMNMDDFGFLKSEEIEVSDIDFDDYFKDEKKHKMIECPHCGFIGEETEFEWI